MKKINIHSISMAGCLAALAIILDFISFKTDTSKFTIYALPLLFSGMLFGPIVGLLTGFSTGLVSQMFSYGFTITTPLWILAPMTWGLFSGLIFNKGFKCEFKLWKIIITIITTSLLITAINTGALYFDGIIMDYPTPYVITQLASRIITSLVVSIIYIILVYLIGPILKKSIMKNYNE